MSSGFESIKHIVVLMLENRSFDNILGATFEPGIKRVNKFYPGDQNRLAIPIPAFPLCGRNTFSASLPTPDPGEFFQYMNQQIFGLRNPLPVNSTPPTEAGELGGMGGFVQNYLRVLGEYDYPKFLLPTIMHQYQASQVPVTAALGKAFAVVDTHYASAPCQTLPNRCFAQLGTALGHVNNDTYDGNYNNSHSNAPYHGKTIFNQINDTPGVDWRVYFGDFPLTLFMADTWIDLFEDKFHFFDRFKQDIDNNSLPEYSWIEPAYQLFPTDNHPPHNVNLGEYMLQEVYNSLRSNPEVWKHTLLIVTYDEHGGCYDHKFPPPAIPDGDNPLFDFSRYGVRVPSLLISPYIEAGTLGTPGAALDSAAVYDHTSILASVRKCFGLKGDPLSKREAKAEDFSAFLTLQDDNLNLGPDSVSVGISNARLEEQAVVETISSLGQLWWEHKHKIPTSREQAEALLSTRGPIDFGSGPSDDGTEDQQKLEEIRASIKQLFGRVPIGLLRYE